MAATSKDELLAVTHKEFAKLQQCLEKADAEFAVAKDTDDTSIKDIAGHRANWVYLFLGWYEDGRADSEVFFPAKGLQVERTEAIQRHYAGTAIQPRMGRCAVSAADSARLRAQTTRTADRNA